SAAKPGEPAADEVQGGDSALRSEPKFLVREIEDFRGHGAQDGGNAKGEKSGQDGDSDHKGKESGLGLPAGGIAAAAEVGSHDIWQLRVVGRKVNRSARYDQQEYQPRKPRVHRNLSILD